MMYRRFYMILIWEDYSWQRLPLDLQSAGRHRTCDTGTTELALARPNGIIRNTSGFMCLRPGFDEHGVTLRQHSFIAVIDGLRGRKYHKGIAATNLEAVS
ncbi:hypothetical protein RRG08_060804 [Elysia crispata]|uniref:Uncharacterized protein n=1 Tax=Elysia crispata TaxID=231223 RepID=A0AAE1D5J9_9GAST|nr:hypothetical protein RRG08_060804 [Elysia crispata]